MKLLLLLSLLPFALFAETRTYTITSEVMGYSCPDGFFYYTEKRLCYPKPTGTNSEPIPSYDSVASIMPSNTGVPRRSLVDKRALHQAVDKILSGKIYRDEETIQLDLE